MNTRRLKPSRPRSTRGEPSSRAASPAPGKPRGLAARKRGPAVACLTAYVDPELARALRMRAASDGRTASALVGDALARFLGELAGT